MSSVSSTRSSDSYETEKSLMKDSHERELRDVQSDYDEELTQAKKEYSERLVEIRKQAADEVRKLKEDQYNSLGRRYRESEQDHLKERRNLAEAHQGAVKAMGRQQEERDEFHSRKMKDSTEAANRRTTEMMEEQKSEFLKTSAEQKRQTDTLKNYYETELANEKNRNLRSSEKLIEENGNQTERALAEQSKKFNEYIAKDHERTQYQLNEKNNEIQGLKTNEDPASIPMEARRKVDEQHYRRTALQMKQLSEQNRKTVDALKSQNARVVQDSLDENAKRIHQISRELKGQNQSEKAVLEKSYRDLAASSEMAETSLRSRHAEEQHRNHEKNEVRISQQEDRHHESLQDQKAYLLDQKQQEQIEMEAKHREVERASAFKLNETRREMEKKLRDQQAEHEVELANVKFENDKKLHDQDRAAKRLLDERVRAYEFQLKHQESLHQEQKRLLTEHYEEELDKVNRNHALNAKKKS